MLLESIVGLERAWIWVMLIAVCTAILFEWEKIRWRRLWSWPPGGRWLRKSMPATKGDIEDLKNQLAQLTTMEKAFEKMNPEPSGESGVRVATVPTGTVLVKEPGKPFMVNLPVPIAGRGRAHFPAGTADLTVKPPADDG